MPLYEYACKTCGLSFEQLRRMADADRELECPNCHSAEVRRQLSTFACGSAGGSSGASAGACVPRGGFT